MPCPTCDDTKCIGPNLEACPTCCWSVSTSSPITECRVDYLHGEDSSDDIDDARVESFERDLIAMKHILTLYVCSIIQLLGIILLCWKTGAFEV